MINFDWYRSFVALYQEGTVPAAAQTLPFPEPSIHQHLTALETTIGSILFYRTPRSFVPTDSAHQLYAQVIKAIETLEAVSQRSFVGNGQLIRLGAPKEFFTELILGRLAQDEQALYTVQFGNAQELILQVAQGELDLAIATQKLLHPDLEYQTLYQEHFWLVAPAQLTIPMDVVNDPPVLERWLKYQPWLAYSEELPLIQLFWQAAFNRRIDINPRLIIPDLRGIRTAVAEGLGLSILPNYLCEEWVRTDRLQILFQPQRPVTNQIWLTYRRRDRQTQGIQLMLKHLSATSGRTHVNPAFIPEPTEPLTNIPDPNTYIPDPKTHIPDAEVKQPLVEI